MHDFGEKLAEGEHFERVLDTYFRRQYEVSRVTDFMQRRGTDRLFMPRGGGPAFGVEYKADSRADQTNNAFIETESVAGEKMGWALTAHAHVLVYYIPPRHLAYWLRLDRLRRALPGWQQRYKVKAAENADYDTLGVVVPLRELRALAERELFIPPSGDLDDPTPVSVQAHTREGWETPEWGRGPLTWPVAEVRTEIARRIWPGRQYRVVAGK